jgi:hypothetical protein
MPTQVAADVQPVAEVKAQLLCQPVSAMYSHRQIPRTSSDLFWLFFWLLTISCTFRLINSLNRLTHQQAPPRHPFHQTRQRCNGRIGEFSPMFPLIS